MRNVEHTPDRTRRDPRIGLTSRRSLMWTPTVALRDGTRAMRVARRGWTNGSSPTEHLVKSTFAEALAHPVIEAMCGSPLGWDQVFGVPLGKNYPRCERCQLVAQVTW